MSIDKLYRVLADYYDYSDLQYLQDNNYIRLNMVNVIGDKRHKTWRIIKPFTYRQPNGKLVTLEFETFAMLL